MAKPSAMFVMPERIAASNAITALTDPVGSEPFRFQRDEWVPGARVAYRRIEGYLPRDEPARMLPGGKRAYVDRADWT